MIAVPDKRRHRGRHPTDVRLFSDKCVPKLQSAVAELSWLLTRGYGETAALKLVGDHHDLIARQRAAVMRCACSDASLEGRRRRQADPAACSGKAIAIDGYNLLITVESALSGGAVLVGRDGCYRDLASVHGTYRKVEETVPALTLIMDQIAALGVARVDWYLDQPVSNSGRLKKLMAELLEERTTSKSDPPWNIELSPNPDRILREYTGVVATCDAAVLDACRMWMHLAGQIMQTSIPQAWILRLGDEGHTPGE